MKNKFISLKLLIVCFLLVAFVGYFYQSENNKLHAEETRSRDVLVACSECSGSGSEACDTCDSEGKVICTTCNGTYECPTCHGVNKAGCKTCNGKGFCPAWCQNGKVNCKKCGGDHLVDCHVCKGSKNETVQGYLLTFDTNEKDINENLSQPSAIAPSDIFNSFPSLTSKGYKFLGWSTNKTSTVAEYTSSTSDYVVTKDETLFAIWEEKQEVLLTEVPQQVQHNGNPQSFVLDGVNSNIGSFLIEYFVDSNWVSDAPTNVGTYNVRITRAEDETYKEYIKEIQNGLVITEAPKAKGSAVGVIFIILGILIIIFVGLFFIWKLEFDKAQKENKLEERKLKFLDVVFNPINKLIFIRK